MFELLEFLPINKFNEFKFIWELLFNCLGVLLNNFFINLKYIKLLKIKLENM